LTAVQSFGSGPRFHAVFTGRASCWQNQSWYYVYV
jgi:hypothetical protein